MHSLNLVKPLLACLALFTVVLTSPPSRHEGSGQASKSSRTDKRARIKERFPHFDFRERRLEIPTALNNKRALGRMNCLPIPEWPWRAAWGDGIDNCHSWLTLQAPYSAETDAHTCSLLCCSLGAENDHPLSQPISYLIQMVENIADGCQQTDGLTPDKSYAGGQFFDTGNFNIILRESDEGGLRCPTNAFGPSRRAAGPNTSLGEVSDQPLKSREVELETQGSLNDRELGKLKCLPIPGWPWTGAVQDDITACINWLYAAGPISAETDAKSCSVVCCSQGAEIWFCNDNNYPLSQPLEYLGQMARNIKEACPSTSHQGPLPIAATAGGQSFDSGNFNVVVRESYQGAPNCPPMSPGPNANYRLPTGKLTWRGEVNGSAYELTGTAPDVLDQLKKRYPEFNPAEDSLEARNSLETRNILFPPLCIPVAGQPWGYGNIAGIQHCVAALNGINGPIGIDAGPGNCGVLCCVNGANVMFCNDNSHWIQPKSTYLAAFAENLISYCTNPNDNHQAGGQQFDSGGFNVYVEGGCWSD